MLYIITGRVHGWTSVILYFEFHGNIYLFLGYPHVVVDLPYIMLLVVTEKSD